MKIVCGACSAKYSIADEKVQGKVFKIRCRKCSNVIVVKGDASGLASPSAPEPFAAEASSGEDGEWYAVIDGAQAGPMPREEIEANFTAGRIDEESYIWREGMGDWLHVRDVSEFAHLTQQQGSTSAGGFGSEPSESAEEYDDDQSTSMMNADELRAGAPNYDQSAPATNEGDLGFGTEEEPGALGTNEGVLPSYGGVGAITSSASAPSQGEALLGAFESEPNQGDAMAYQSFSGVDSFQAAGGDASVLDDAPGGEYARGANGQIGSAEGQGIASANDLVGVRNENSVLFSLSSLQQVEAVDPAAADAPVTEGSGLIDIQSLATAHHKMSSGGAGLGDASQPGDLYTPAATMGVPAIMPRGSHRDNKPLIIGVAAVCVLLFALATVFAAIVLTRDSEPRQVIVEKPIAPAQDQALAEIRKLKEQLAANQASEASQTASLAEEQMRKRIAELEAQQEDSVEEEGEDEGRSGRRRDRPRSRRDRAADKTAAAASPPPVRRAKKNDIDDIMKDIESGKEKKSAAASSRDTKAPTSTAAKADGSLPKKISKPDVQKTIRKYNGRIKGCGKGKSGNVWVRMNIGASGRVTAASIHGKSKEFSGTPTGNCVLSIVRKMKFPAAQNGTPISGYPFIL